MESRVKSKARVQITVEIELQGWGPECPIGQLYSQSGSSAVEKIKQELREIGCPMRLVGEPKIMAVITEESP